jgi:TRAP-type C4-dicarboxylate transport system permease small subunit
LAARASASGDREPGPDEEGTMLKVLQKIDELVSKAEFALICVFLTVILLFSFTGVILRNVFHSGSMWMDVLAKNLVLWITMLGAALAVKNRRTLNIEVLNRLIPESKKKYLHIVLTLTSIAVCSAAAYACVGFLESEADSRDLVLWNMPMTYIEIVIPVGYVLICYHFLVQLVGQITDAVRGNP